jgi:hypothetical protein
MGVQQQACLIRFLRRDLAIPEDSIQMALGQAQYPTLLPMVLWQYGLVTLQQLDRIFDWIERNGSAFGDYEEVI